MTDFTILHISDTHLSAQHPQFEPNFRALLPAIEAQRPDLVINTGDLTVDGAGRPADHVHVHAHALHALLPVRWRVVPGNHDLGDNPAQPGHRPRHAFDAAQRQRYRAVWGDDYWAMDAGHWRLIGLNAQLCGSADAAEDAQLAFLRQEVQELADRPLGLFLHKPLFVDAADEPEPTSRCVPPAPRRALMALLAQTRLRLVASGHVHQHRLRAIDGVLHAWGPSSAFLLPEAMQATVGHKALGYLLYRLHDDEAHAKVVVPPALVQHKLQDIPEPYGSLRPYLEGRAVYVP